MALNFCRKINKNIARNCTRFFLGSTHNHAQVNIPEESVHEAGRTGKLNKFAIPSKHRTTQPENPMSWANNYEPESAIMQRNIQRQYLQPATMPSYIDKPIFDKNFMDALQEEPIKRAQTMNNSASQQILESFKNKQSQNLSSRFPKMTLNPFPDPVKTIFSPHTLCDQEKADIMFQDHQAILMRPMRNSIAVDFGLIKSSRKFYCTSSLQVLNPPESLMTQATRSYACKKKSTSKPCKKLGKDTKPKRCNKTTIKGCPPVRCNTICKKKSQEVRCKKVEPPYPSFSESCSMEPKARQSECEICPWNEKNNPNFKGKFKKPPNFYHTLCCNSPHNTTKVENVLINSSQRPEQNSPSQIWMHKANLSQINNRGNEMPSMDFVNPVNTPKAQSWQIEATEEEEWLQKEEIQRRNLLKLGYCDRHETVLTEFISSNKDFMKNFKNGDDLDEFGFEKTALCKILSSDEMLNCTCEKDNTVTDYPKDCNKPPDNKVKNCPKGLAHKKTKKERLKRKIPKDQTP